MNNLERLELASHILSSDASFEADCVGLDEAQGRAVTEREKQLAWVVDRLYMLIHPAFSCKHPDWDEENERRYKEICPTPKS
ncbi:MAG: hypothetical protein WC764_04305 [Candidatus Paceibacterota bacterium]|jgi:hypothetical protein